MPNMILEYSDNVEFEPKVFFKALHESIAEVETVNMKGIRSRAIKLTDYYIADGHPDYQMVHLNIIIREGRSREIQEEIAQRAMAQLEAAFGHYRDNGGYIALSTDMNELEFGIALTKHNIPKGGVPK